MLRDAELVLKCGCPQFGPRGVGARRGGPAARAAAQQVGRCARQRPSGQPSEAAVRSEGSQRTEHPCEWRQAGLREQKRPDPQPGVSVCKQAGASVAGDHSAGPKRKLKAPPGNPLH